MSRAERGQRFTLRLLLGADHPCSYLPGRSARSLYVAPREALDPARYEALAREGFRRSGALVYRPHCATCSACVAVRLEVERFQPDRSQRRCLRANADLGVRVRGPEFDQERFALYRRYLGSRHAGGGMDDHGPEEFHDFLAAAWAETEFLELRLDSRLVAVAVTDVLPRALSAVYTFFDPGLARRGLGTYAILRQIERARRLRRRHLYLGYWIAGCAKMSYKSAFGPQQRLTGGAWAEHPPARPAPGG